MKLLKGTAVAIVKNWGSRGRVFEHLENVHEACMDKAVGRGKGDGDMVRQELDCVGDSGPARVNGIDVEAAISFRGGAEVPALASVRVPGAASGGLFMDEDTTAGGRNGGTIKVVWAPDLSVGG